MSLDMVLREWRVGLPYSLASSTKRRGSITEQKKKNGIKTVTNLPQTTFKAGQVMQERSKKKIASNTVKAKRKKKINESHRKGDERAFFIICCLLRCARDHFPSQPQPHKKWRYNTGRQGCQNSIRSCQNGKQ